MCCTNLLLLLRYRLALTASVAVDETSAGLLLSLVGGDGGLAECAKANAAAAGSGGDAGDS